MLKMFLDYIVRNVPTPEFQEEKYSIELAIKFDENPLDRKNPNSDPYCKIYLALLANYIFNYCSKSKFNDRLLLINPRSGWGFITRRYDRSLDEERIIQSCFWKFFRYTASDSLVVNGKKIGTQRIEIAIPLKDFPQDFHVYVHDFYILKHKSKVENHYLINKWIVNCWENSVNILEYLQITMKYSPFFSNYDVVTAIRQSENDLGIKDNNLMKDWEYLNNI